MKVVDILELLDANPKGSFLDAGAFNGASFGAADITGVAPGWEMHPDTDEFFYIIDGEFEMVLLGDESRTHHVAGRGSSFIVPKGVWHKPGAPKGAKFIFFTPGESLVSDADDPRA